MLKLLYYALLLAFGFLLLKVFVPRTYHAPEVQQRESTQYWELATGSVIGYTLISAKGEKKPYPLIYLHGGPGVPVSDQHIQMLSAFSGDGYDVYLYDQVGCGQSGLLDDMEAYTARRHTQDLEAIVEKTGAEKVILLGQSWGAMLAVLFAADHPEKVEKLIFTGPGPIAPVKAGLAGVPAPDSLHLRKPLISNREGFRSMQTLRNRLVAFLATKFGYKLASDKEANGFYYTMTNQTNKAMVCDTSRALRAEPGVGYYSSIMTLNSLDDVEDPRPKLKDSEIPVLLLKGQCDNQVWGIVPEYLALFKNHELVIVPDAGHGIWIEQPEFYLKTIRKFLAKEAMQ